MNNKRIQQLRYKNNWISFHAVRNASVIRTLTVTTQVSTVWFWVLSQSSLHAPQICKHEQQHICHIYIYIYIYIIAYFIEPVILPLYFRQSRFFIVVLPSYASHISCNSVTSDSALFSAVFYGQLTLQPPQMQNSLILTQGVNLWRRTSIINCPVLVTTAPFRIRHT